MKKLNLLLYFLSFTSFLFSQETAIYVSDAGNFSNPPWQILKFDANGENPEAFIDTNITWPQDILFLEDVNEVLITNLFFVNGTISRHNATTGDFIANFTTGIAGPTRMKIGPDNLLYVLQWSGNGKVLRYQLDGTFVDEFTSVGVSNSIGLDWDTEGNLYVSSYNGSTVRKFNTNGDDLGLFVTTNLNGPTNIWFDTAGNLLVNNYNISKITKFDANGIFIEDVVTTNINSPEGVAIYPNGDLLIGNSGNGSVQKFDSSFNFLGDFILPHAGGLLRANAVVIREIATASILDLALENKLLIPSVGSTFFLNDSAKDKIQNIAIYNILGELIKEIKVTPNFIFNAKNINDGVYFVLADYEGQKVSQKIIIKK